MAKILHCGLTLTPITETIFVPMLSTLKAKYNKEEIVLKEHFQSISLFEYRCNGTCPGTVYAWQGVFHNGIKAEPQQIKPRDVDGWLKMSDGGTTDRKKGASAVQGSKPFWPFTFREMIPV